MGFIDVGLLFLLIHQRFCVFRRLRVDHVPRAVLLLYLMLLGYDLTPLEPSRAPAQTNLIMAMGVTLAVMGPHLDCNRLKIMACARTGLPMTPWPFPAQFIFIMPQRFQD